MLTMFWPANPTIGGFCRADAFMENQPDVPEEETITIDDLDHEDLEIDDY